ncbi:Separin [Leucoagaricus sp. SymC.cos]|nr:Separin [Leucoagaricus sp. SymC.cos]
MKLRRRIRERGKVSCFRLLSSEFSVASENPGLVDKIQTCSSDVRDSTILVPLLCAIVLEAADSETKRVAEKVDRALERLRRLISAWLDRFSAVADQVFSSTKELFSVIAEILRLTIRDVIAPFLSDLTTRALDSLFTLAKLTLKVSHPETHTHTYDVLGTAASILTEVNPSGIPLANFLRCLSGAYYNFAGNFYQAGQHGPAVPFLKEACNLGAKALSRRSKAKNDGEEKAREQEGWKQLEETLFRRWELLGICYMKIGDRKNAYIAFLRSLVMFPYALYDLPTETGKIPPSRIFSSSKTSIPFAQLAAVIDRVTYIGLNELLLSVDQISFQHSLSSSESMRDPRLIGILIEEQVKSLEQRSTRDSAQKSIRALLESALKVYSKELNMPVRRARVTLRLLEVLYRIDNTLPFGEIQAMAQEIDTLLLTEDLGGDTELGVYRAQYRALGHLWLALHAHRAAVSNQVSLVADHVEQACRILRSLFPKTSTDSPKVAVARKSLTPQQPTAKTRTRARTRTAVTTAATGATTRSKARVAPTAPTTAASKKMSTTTKKEPLTPAPKRGVLQPMPLNTETPPRTKIQAIKHPLVFDDFDRFSGVLQTVVRVLGLLSLSLQKVQLLDVLRKLAETHGGPTSEGYINASLDLAHEYMRIGKTRRATAIFTQALETVRAGHVSEETSALFLLRFAESLALIENVPRSSSVYCEALAVSKRIEYDEKSETTVQRVHARVRRLEKAALAARTVAMIQHCKEDLTMSIELLLQSLRLWNRAMDNLMRLSPPPSASKQPAQDDNPFDMSSLKQALPSETQPLPDPTPQIVVPPQRHLDNLSLRISEGLFAVLFDLAQAYLIRGSAKESEFFITQALDLAKALNAPAMLSRALAKQGEVQVRLGNTKDGYTLLVEAGEVLSGVPTIDNVEVVRLTAECRAKMGEEDAGVLYGRSVDLLREIDVAFEKYEIVTSGPRKSFGLSPVSGKSVRDIVVPDILTSVLRQQIWLLRDQNDEQLKALLEQFISLPQSSLTKAQENSLLAKLNLHNVYFRFQSDMFLNSLAESPIAIPMGMHATQKHASISAQDINNTLDQAEEQFWNSLALIARRGNVLDVRESTVALAVIKSFQTSMGHKNEKIHVLVSRLLDAAAALTLRREMLEAIHHKFPRSPSADDMQWPLITAEGAMLPPPVAGSNFAARKRVNIPVDSEDDDDDDEKSDADATPPLKSYWESVRMRYRSYSLDSFTLSSPQTEKLPSNWTVIHINVTEDKNTLFVSRQEGGAKGDGLVFSVPLKSRRDNGSGDDDEDYLTFHDVMHELREIVKLSDQGTKAAVHIKPDDGAARAAWWKQRAELDSRLKNLLENIEFCWFGAFKTILSPKCTSSHEAITELGDQFEKVFRRSFGIQDTKRGGNPRKTSSQHLPQSFNQVRLDDSLLRCFSTLSPKCRDEELEDLIYFILDLYQFHGVAIPISEVDITQMVVDLRTILEEHTMKTRGQINKKASTITPESDDEHVFLVLDKNLQGLPWESIPILRGRSVSRIPSVDFLIDRLEYVEVRKRYRRAVERTSGVGAVVDPRKGFFILNPSGDLRKTQERFKDWADGMKKTGWDGVVGKPISEQQFENALRQSDLVVYFGHGGGEQYLRSYKIRRLQTCAATMLWGCSSGALREMGDFDRTGTANAYMLGGCPTLVANLWDVTDRDIDKFSQAVFDKVKLTPENVRVWSEADTAGVSLVSAVAQARSVCKLKYLTGAAPVVYGIPFYL